MHAKIFIGYRLELQIAEARTEERTLRRMALQNVGYARIWVCGGFLFSVCERVRIGLLGVRRMNLFVGDRESSLFAALGYAHAC